MGNYTFLSALSYLKTIKSSNYLLHEDEEEGEDLLERN
jgi:hypothetical protein